ncbi:MAG: DUF5658 family protein [Bryobacteraceae bacterium]
MPILLYAYLQTLDLLSTLAFLVSGVEEGNPFVRYAIESAPAPWIGLLGVKLAALLIGVFCWRLGRLRLLIRANVFFALLVAWNLLALVVAQSAA